MTASTRLLWILLSFALSHALQSSASIGRRERNSCVATSPLRRHIVKTNNHRHVLRLTRLRLSSSNPDEDQESKLSKLGFTPQELKVSRESDDDASVNVNLVEDIDAVTLTAVGFGLIAINFFIFANMGDGGLGGVVASIINLSRQ